MTPRVDVDDFLLAVMADTHDVPIHTGRGRRWIRIVNPVTGAVVRVVACRPNPAEVGSAKAAAEAQAIREAAGYVPAQRTAVQ